MIDLGVVRPGTTIRIPFSSFDKDDGSAITMTNYAAADILIYKDGSTTERASTAGFTATTDFDAKTGKHLAIIDLADNTTAGFFNAGSEYLVAIDAVTVDAVTTGGWIARFVIGYPDAILNTTIATLASQTSFTLTAGPAEDSAILGCVALVHDIASAVQFGLGVISAYTGATKTITLTNGVTFTAASGDNISIFPPGNARWIAAILATAIPLDAAGTRSAVGLASANLDTQLSAIDDFIDTEVSTIVTQTSAASIRSAVGLASANIDTQLSTIDDFLDTEIAAILAAVDTEVAAIKAKTDQLIFTTANQVDATTVTNSDKTGYTLTADFRIKKNTALSAFTFLMVDTSDNPATGLTVTAQRSLDGGALAAMANSVVEISNGLYKINLAAADTNADICCYRFTATGAKDRVVVFPTQTE